MSSAFNYPDSSVAIELTQELIRIPSLTPVTPDLLPTAQRTLDYLEDYLSQHGATCQRLLFSGDDKDWGYTVDNLYAEWIIDQSAPTLCFMGHTDVVAPGELKEWTTDPYSGKIVDGWVYGRGATDMKGAVATFCVASAEAIRTLENKPVNISLIITTDEEWVAINGSRKVLNWMKENDKSVDAFIVGEPSSSDVFGSHIKVGRRGSLCGTLDVQGVQGHAAYQDLFNNPNRALSLATTILNGYQWDHNIPHFPPTNFEIIALDAGNFENTSIVPGKASAFWNVRFTSQYTTTDIADILTRLLNEPPDWAKYHPDFSSLKDLTISAHIETVSRPYYSKPGTLADVAKSVVQNATGIIPQLDGAGGTTDGRFIQEFYPEAQIVELGLPEKGGITTGTPPDDYGERGGMHQLDERCSIKDIEKLLECYIEITREYAIRY